jgi:hypothetical protein
MGYIKKTQLQTSNSNSVKSIETKEYKKKALNDEP